MGAVACPRKSGRLLDQSNTEYSVVCFGRSKCLVELSHSSLCNFVRNFQPPGHFSVMSYGTAKCFSKKFSELRCSRTFIICTVAIAVFVDMFLYSLIIPILPTLLTDRAQVTASKVQVALAGLLAAYNLAIVICAPVSGYFADKWSNRKMPLLGGLFALAGATVLFTLSKNLGLLYLARILQGASASIVWVVGLALLVDATSSEGIGSAMGWVSLGLSLGDTCGPLISGVVYERAGHYTAFSVAFAVITVDIILRCLLLGPQSQHVSTLKEVQPGQDSAPQSIEFYVLEGMSSRIAEGMPQLIDSQSGLEHQQEKDVPPGSFNIFKLLRYPDMLCSLWCIFMITVVLTGLEAVRELHYFPTTSVAGTS
jgi:MFS family permease